MEITPIEIEYEGRRYRLVKDYDPLPFLDGVSKPYQPTYPDWTGAPLPRLPTVTIGPGPITTTIMPNNNDIQFTYTN